MGERVAAVALGLLLALPAQAARDFGVVTLDLRAEGGVVPTHVCVVTGAASARTRHRLVDLLAPGEAPAPSRRLSLAALDLPDTPGCQEAGTDRCAPQVVLPPAWSDPAQVPLACATDALASDEARRAAPAVLVLQLEALEASPPPVDSLSVAGGVVTLGVAADVRRMTLAARVVGGHYAPQRVSVRAEPSGPDELLLVLPVAPRCRWVDLALPGVRVPESAWDGAGLTLDGVGVEPSACLQPAPGGQRVRVRVPRAEPGATGEVAVDLPSGDPSTPRSLSAWWTGPWPGADVALQLTRVDFTWRRPTCVVAEDACPAAFLPTGVACSASSVPGGCAVTCPGDGAPSEAALTLPAQVVLETGGPTRLRWSELLRQPGDVLTSFAPELDVPLTVDTAGWVVGVPGARVHTLELRAPDGSTRRYPVAPEAPIVVPFAHPSCDPVRYRFLGDRVHEEGLATVEGGRLQVAAPEHTARVLGFELAVLAGGAQALVAPPQGADAVAGATFFTSTLQLVARFRPRSPRLARWSFELRLGGSLGQWGFLEGAARAADGRDVLEVRDKPLWGRVLGDAAVVVDLAPPVALALGVGAGGGWPVASADRARTGQGVLVGPSLDLRFRARPWLAIVLQGRAWFGERLRFTPSSGDEQDLQATSLLGQVGLQVRL